MGVSKRIKPSLYFSRMSDSVLILLCRAVIKGMTGNPYFPLPPVSIKDLEAAVDRFTSAWAATLSDGGRTATVERDRCRQEVIPMMRALGNYVEDHCDNDMAKFVTSGFNAIPAEFAPPQQCPRPDILKITQGETGVLIVSFTPLYRKARSFELEYAEEPKEGLPQWTMIRRPSARPPARVENLKRGVVYLFRIRAFAYGTDTFTDWSGVASRRCI